MIIISYVQTFLGDIKQTPNDRVLCWLGLNYVSANHTAARDKYEPKTGSWFLTSDTFIEWSNALNSSLWLHGKPGFGKTILSSSIIEHVIGLCKARPPDQCAYFLQNPDFFTVPGLFDSARLLVSDVNNLTDEYKADAISISFDPQYGFPNRMAWNPPEPTEWEVLSFKVNP